MAEKKFGLNALNAAVDTIERAYTNPPAAEETPSPQEPESAQVVAQEEGIQIGEADEPAEKKEEPKKKKRALKKEEVKIVNMLVPKSIYKKLVMIQFDRNVSARQLCLELLELGLKHYNPKDHEE